MLCGAHEDVGGSTSIFREWIIADHCSDSLNADDDEKIVVCAMIVVHAGYTIFRDREQRSKKPQTNGNTVEVSRQFCQLTDDYHGPWT
ncbi:hypothetical protein V9T40_005039 [Parthenolecanium corni]|uniref:Uncharacterized protein n=1 Tax=Parthenolecanium corni TaxID=536013 RepID=A0AAN9TU80_9HEMI